MLHRVRSFYAGLAAVSYVVCLIVPEVAYAQADEVDDKFYVGAFGGLANVGGQDVRQRSTAYRRADFALPGFRDFDLQVNVEGRTRSRHDPLVGLQVGHRFDDGRSRIVPALEIEAIYLASDRRTNLVNSTDEIVTNIGMGDGQKALADPRPLIAEEYGAGRHRFDNRMQMRAHLIMANAVLGYQLSDRFEPYVGGGVGAAVVGMRRAVSYQTNPFGPIEQTTDTHEDVNHFNSDPNETRLTFAYLAKAGLQMRLTGQISSFIEYRFIHMNGADFEFGATQYTGHATTDRWSVHSGGMGVHAAIAGLRLSF